MQRSVTIFTCEGHFFPQVDSSKESAEAACDILSQLVNCSLKTLGLISTARPSFMDLPKVSAGLLLLLLVFTEKSRETLPIFSTYNGNIRKVVSVYIENPVTI